MFLKIVHLPTRVEKVNTPVPPAVCAGPSGEDNMVAEKETFVTISSSQPEVRPFAECWNSFQQGETSAMLFGFLKRATDMKGFDREGKPTGLVTFSDFVLLYKSLF